MDESLKTVRRIHYAVIAACAALLLFAFAPRTSARYDRAREDLMTLRRIPFGKVRDTLLARPPVRVPLGVPAPDPYAPFFDAILTAPDSTALRAGVYQRPMAPPAGDTSLASRTYWIRRLMNPNAPLLYRRSDREIMVHTYPRPRPPVLLPEPVLNVPENGSVGDQVLFLRRIPSVQKLYVDPESPITREAYRTVDRLPCRRCELYDIRVRRVDSVYVLTARVRTADTASASALLELKVGTRAQANPALNFRRGLEWVVPELDLYRGGAAQERVLADIDRVWTDVHEHGVDEAIAIIEEKRAETRQRASVLGLTIDERVVGTAGPLLLALLVIYLSVQVHHLRWLAGRPGAPEVMREFPWTPLHADTGRAVTEATLRVLPLATVLMTQARSVLEIQEADRQPLEFPIALLVTVVLLACLVVPCSVLATQLANLRRDLWGDTRPIRIDALTSTPRAQDSSG